MLFETHFHKHFKRILWLSFDFIYVLFEILGLTELEYILRKMLGVSLILQDVTWLEL